MANQFILIEKLFVLHVNTNFIASLQKNIFTKIDISLTVILL
jgi:hypothetical protein